MDTSIPPIGLGESKIDPPFKADLGKKYWIGSNMYRLVKAGALIAAASQGKQVETPITAGVASFAVALNTTLANHLVCGAIPSVLTGAIAASAYFLALMDGQDALAQTATAASAITTGSILVSGTASDLVRATTAVVLPSDVAQQGALACGFSLQLNTGTALLPYVVNYRAPFR